MSVELGSVVKGQDGLYGWLEPLDRGEPSNRPGGDTTSWASVRLPDGRRVYVPENAFIRQDDGSFFLPMSLSELAVEPVTRSARGAVPPGHPGQDEVPDWDALHPEKAHPDAPIHAPHDIKKTKETEMTQANTGRTASAAATGTTVQSQAQSIETRQAVAGEAGQVVPVVEEVLHVDKRQVEGAAVRVQKVVSERQEAIDVPLSREHVDVERVPVNRIVERVPEVRREGDVIIVPVVEEVLVMEKRIMLREEVRMVRRVEQTREQQTVTLRKEDVEVKRE